MNLKEFEKYLACYGADLETWPDTLAKEARQALNESDKHQMAWQEAKKLDRLMSTNAAPEPSEDFAAGIIAQASLLPQESAPSLEEPGLNTWWPRLLRPLPALALTTCLVVGIITGLYTQNPLAAGESLKESGTEWAQLLYTEESMLWDENSN